MLHTAMLAYMPCTPLCLQAVDVYKKWLLGALDSLVDTQKPGTSADGSEGSEVVQVTEAHVAAWKAHLRQAVPKLLEFKAIDTFGAQLKHLKVRGPKHSCALALWCKCPWRNAIICCTAASLAAAAATSKMNLGVLILHVCAGMFSTHTLTTLCMLRYVSHGL